MARSRVAAGIGLAIAMLLPAVAPADEPVREGTRDGYVLHAWDGVTMWSTILNVDYYGKPNRVVPEPAAPFSRRILEELIDEEAAAHVDAISYCLFTAFESDVPSSKVTDLFRWRPPGLDAAGIDPLKVLIDRCHFHGMQFIADIRMNDRHGGAAHGIAKQHPEWTILGTAYNYALDDVRKAMLSFDKEVLDAYDVDGIEYDYLRWCHMFKPGEGRQNSHLLNDFTRQTRKLLDDSAARRGRKRLLLGVRVPQTIGECDYLGFDLATWIREGLVDYVVPSDFMHTDTNMKTEDFVKLAKGTACKIYPAIHNRIGMDEPNEHYRLMALENLRAAAQNYYRFGADGVSPYNFQFAFERRAVAHRSSAYSAIMWPAALGWLRELRYPDQIALHDRHYLFFANGQSVFEGDPVPAFHQYVIDLNWETTGRRQPLMFGDNQLDVRLIPVPPSANGTVSIEELECYVYVRKPKRLRIESAHQ